MKPMLDNFCHNCAPKEWKVIPDRTGSYELDGVIHHNPNPDMRTRLHFYLDQSDTLYGPRTGYSGYNGYSGDD
jgi:hypothetical protein